MELPVIGWKIYYADESVYSSEDHKWEDCPDIDVIFVVLLHEDKRVTTMGGMDVYYLTDTGFGSYTDVKENYNLPNRKYGVYVPDELDEKITNKAKKDIKKWQTGY